MISLTATLSILFAGGRLSAATASAVGDPCSSDNPCTPLGLGLYCDYSIGPDAGGLCVACDPFTDGWWWCDELDLTELGELDCWEKCVYKECTEPCEEGWFCSFEDWGDGPCQECEYWVPHPNECPYWYFSEKGEEACMDTCPPRTCSESSDCLGINADVNFFCDLQDDDEGGEPSGVCEPCAGLKSTDECADRGSSLLGTNECVQACQDVIPTFCATNDDCAGWNREPSFCNGDGTCQSCPAALVWGEDWPVDQCFDAEIMGLSDEGAANCAVSCGTICVEQMVGSVIVEGLASYIGEAKTLPLLGTVYATVAGPLVDCQLGGEGECPPDAPPGFVCLVSGGLPHFLGGTYYSNNTEEVLNCEQAGGIATILYNNATDNSILQAIGSNAVTTPATMISLRDGLHLLKNGLGLETTVSVKRMERCDRGCSDRIPCPTSDEGARIGYREFGSPMMSGEYYCDYEGDTYGYCQRCSADEDKQRDTCFLSGLSLRGAQECAATCDSTLASASCKFCGRGVSGSGLQSSTEGEEKCNFCPDGLKQSHYDRVIPFLGSSATCFKMYQFFLNYDIAQDNANCQLALGFNYICDCEGPGYAGADSDSKRQALIWVPRASAIMSFFGSATIIVDHVRDRSKLKKPYGQLMVTMSVFDLMGSIAYSLTTLPIPKDYYVEGSKGNTATCKAQGFFIQMGTVAAFINVSLAVFYFCVIKLNWGEMRVNKIRRWLLLCPIAVGLAFAFAGIPFYEMLFLWCNNGALWWPDIPVAIAILVTTIIMITICSHVYRTERATQRYSRGRLTTFPAVFWQSIWYLFSFYLTWVPYLSLQYSWAAGAGYSSYGFVLFASTLVPLQGFWNCVVYFRKRLSRKISALSRRAREGIVALFGRVREGITALSSYFSSEVGSRVNFSRSSPQEPTNERASSRNLDPKNIMAPHAEDHGALVEVDGKSQEEEQKESDERVEAALGMDTEIENDQLNRDLRNYQTKSYKRLLKVLEK